MFINVLQRIMSGFRISGSFPSTISTATLEKNIRRRFKLLFCDFFDLIVPTEML